MSMACWLIGSRPRLAGRYRHAGAGVGVHDAVNIGPRQIGTAVYIEARLIKSASVTNYVAVEVHF